MKENIAIYKYQNRKYYARGLGYLSLKKIFTLVKSGKEITVLDRKTKKDLTKETLIRCLTNNFVENQDRIVLKDIEETIQTLDASYNILDKVDF